MQNGQSSQVLLTQLEKIKENFNSLYNQFIYYLETDGANKEKLNITEQFLETLMVFEADCNYTRNILKQSDERLLSLIATTDLNMKELRNKFNQICSELEDSTSDEDENIDRKNFRTKQIKIENPTTSSSTPKRKKDALDNPNDVQQFTYTLRPRIKKANGDTVAAIPTKKLIEPDNIVPPKQKAPENLFIRAEDNPMPLLSPASIQDPNLHLKYKDLGDNSDFLHSLETEIDLYLPTQEKLTHIPEKPDSKNSEPSKPVSVDNTEPNKKVVKLDDIWHKIPLVSTSSTSFTFYKQPTERSQQALNKEEEKGFESSK